MKTIDITHPMMGWDKEDRTFACELSDIEETRFEITHCLHRRENIKLLNSKTGNYIIATLDKVDTDGEDIFGWWYKSSWNGSPIKILFLND